MFSPTVSSSQRAGRGGQPGEGALCSGRVSEFPPPPSGANPGPEIQFKPIRFQIKQITVLYCQRVCFLQIKSHFTGRIQRFSPTERTLRSLWRVPPSRRANQLRCIGYFWFRQEISTNINQGGFNPEGRNYPVGFPGAPHAEQDPSGRRQRCQPAAPPAAASRRRRSAGGMNKR